MADNNEFLIDFTNSNISVIAYAFPQTLIDKVVNHDIVEVFDAYLQKIGHFEYNYDNNKLVAIDDIGEFEKWSKALGNVNNWLKTRHFCLNGRILFSNEKMTEVRFVMFTNGHKSFRKRKID